MVEVPDVVYAAFGATADRVAGEIEGFDDVYITHDNCPHQSVICGPADHVEQIVKRLRGKGVMAQTMPFRTGFHSPVYAPHTAAARAMLGQLEVRPPSVPLWSATSLAPFPEDADDVRDLVLRHLVEPVRFRRLTELLYDSGIRAFVQVGQGSLVGFAEDTLRDREHLAISAAVSAHDGLAQLRRVAAALWADGLSPDFAKLPAPPAPAREGNTVRLRLGEPMVRLPGMDGLVPVPAGSGAYEVGAGAGSPVVAALNAALADTAAAARTVTDAWHRPGTLAPGRPAATGDGRNGAAAIAPAGAAPEESGPPRTLTRTRVFSLATMPDTVDHCVFPQARGWPDMTDRFPVVPLTTMLELMAGAATELVPGAVVTGIAQVKAARWLSTAPETTTAVHATRGDIAPDGQVAVKVVIEGYSSGVVHLSTGAAPAYPPAPEPSLQPLLNPRPAPVAAHELYDGDWMFHGPKFAGVIDIGSLGDDGIDGALTNLPAEGALLDSAGQLIGHWMQVSRTVNQTVLPTGIRAVRFFGPKPPVGARLDCTGWIREITDTEMRADAEIRDGDGRVWCLIEGWTTRRFATDDRIWNVKFRPQSETLSEPRPGGWCVVREQWPDTGSRELIMRRYLCAAERPRYDELTPNTRRAWLLGRIAAKDAVRQRLWELGAGPIYPAEITVDNDDQGRPHATGAFRATHVSLAHCAGKGRRPGIGVALAGPGPVGIDIEAVAERDAGTEEIALTPAERALLDERAGGDRAALFTRLWTAKEAVAKALGTGLAGRPHDFEVASPAATGDDDLTLVVTVPDGTVYRVETTMITNDATVYAVAWTHGKDAK